MNIATSKWLSPNWAYAKWQIRPPTRVTGNEYALERDSPNMINKYTLGSNFSFTGTSSSPFLDIVESSPRSPFFDFLLSLLFDTCTDACRRHSHVDTLKFSIRVRHVCFQPKVMSIFKGNKHSENSSNVRVWYWRAASWKFNSSNLYGDRLDDWAIYSAFCHT